MAILDIKIQAGVQSLKKQLEFLAAQVSQCQRAGDLYQYVGFLEAQKQYALTLAVAQGEIENASKNTALKPN